MFNDCTLPGVTQEKKLHAYLLGDRPMWVRQANKMVSTATQGQSTPQGRINQGLLGKGTMVSHRPDPPEDIEAFLIPHGSVRT